jgi:hypothetical protein
MGAMSDKFDPYWQWLGISPEQQPPDHYRLLGLATFETDVGKISAAAERTAERVTKKAGDRYPGHLGRLLQSIAEAHQCLTNRRQKAAYDQTMTQRGGTPGAENRSPPPLPKPRMLDLPPFIPSPPPLEAGPPPVAGEPPPPPVPGESSAHPQPAYRPRNVSSTGQPPPVRSTDPERSDDAATPPPPPPVRGMPADESQSPPVMGQPAPVMGEPPPVMGELPPVMGQPPGVSDTAASSPKSAVPPVSTAPPLPTPGMARDAAEPPRGGEPENGQSRRSPSRSVPLPRRKTGPAIQPVSGAPTVDSSGEAKRPPARVGDTSDATSSEEGDRDRQQAVPSSPADVEPGKPSSKSRSGVSPATLQRALRPLPAAAGNRGGDSRRLSEGRRDDARSDKSLRRRKGLPWPIIVPAGGGVLALLVGLAVLWGGNGNNHQQTAQGPDLDASDANVPGADDEGHIVSDRDDEGFVEGAEEAGTSTGNGSTDGESPAAGAEAADGADVEQTPSGGDTANGSVAASTAAIKVTREDETAEDTASDEDNGGDDPAAVGDEAMAAAGDDAGAATDDKPPPPEPPPPPPENPFREFPKQFGFSSALESATEAAKEHPLDETAGWVRIAKLPLAEGQQLSVQLLGGEMAIPGDDAFSLHHEFSLQAGTRWRVDVAQGPEVTFPVGWFAVADGQLTFQPDDSQHVAAKEHLQNCLLQLNAAGESHLLTLRRPQPAAPFLLHLHLNEFQESIPISGLPDPEAVRLQVVKLVGTGQPTRLPSDPSAWVGDSVVVELLDKNRNAPAAIRVICEEARAKRVRFRITPMGRTSGRGAATMGIQSATSEVSRLQRDKANLNLQLKAMDARIKLVSSHNREMANQIGKAKKPIQTRIRAIDGRIGQLNQVTARLKPLHQKASIQLRVLMRVDGHDVVLAGPP